MWQNKNKALTFSFDDGVKQDIRLVEILIKYGLKGTFNLNSGFLQTPGATKKDNMLAAADVKKVYEGHEGVLSYQELSIDERNAVIERILSDIKGRMMEDIVLLETKIANPRKQVFQLQFAVGEFDMVVADSANATCEIYEVKHSKEQTKEQYRHLIDEEKLKSTEFRYGKITKKVVIYRGENTTLKNGIEYRNVEEYLKSIV